MANASNPATDAASVTPDDSNDLARPCRALFIGGAGNLKVDTIDGTTITFTSVPVGVFPLQVKRVHSSTTTATNIVALY